MGLQAGERGLADSDIIFGPAKAKLATYFHSLERGRPILLDYGHWARERGREDKVI